MTHSSSAAASGSGVGPTPQLLQTIREMYGEGRYLDAYGRSQEAGPLIEWTDVDAQVLGGRLAHNLGSPRTCRILHRRAHRQAPQHPESCYFYVLSVVQRRGPWKTWQTLREIGDLEGADPHVQADWFAVHAHVLALLRDFQRAEEWFARAEQLAPERAWIWVERALIYEIEDRLDEALEACQRAMELRPYYRPAVQMTAHRLVQMQDRDDEAIQLLEDAGRRLQSPDVLIQLASLYVEKEIHYDRAWELLQRAEQMSPLLDPLRRRWTAAREADVAYYLDNHDSAAQSARLVKTPFYDRFAERLEDKATERWRKRLDVRFVKQHHLTCAPATLAAISEYWRREVDHLELAEEICYDGTPGHRERRWAEDNGFVTREFRVTDEVARTLIDREMPFTLTTVDPGSAHLQAVIGYDSTRGTLLVRDPNERHFGEYDLEEMLKYYGSSGPRGMVMAPAEEAHRLEGVDFPEGRLYDLNYQMERALETFQRDEAQRHFDAMLAESPEHRMTLQARGTLAKYDTDLHELSLCVDALLEQYPKDVNLLTMKLGLLREDGTRQERLELLQELYAQPDCDPLFWSQYAYELRDDAEKFDEAATQLLRAMRHRPHDGRAYGLLAEIRMDQRRREEALLLQRFAASLDDTDESRSRTYFYMARSLGRTKEALDFLQDRFRRFSTRSSAPARTLAWAFDELEHASKAFDLLEDAVKRRPDDGDFQLYLADMYGRYGNSRRAQELLEQAGENCHPMNRRKTAATLAVYRGDLPEALRNWQEVLEHDPFDSDGHDHVARLLADLHGEEAAIEHLTRVAEANPRSYAMRVRLIEWLRGGDADDYERQLHELNEMHDDAWGRRELAVAMIKQNRLDEAAAEIEIAERLEPESPVVHYLWGYLRQRQGDIQAARAAYREALRKSVDYDLAIGSLIECCDSKADRVEELNFVYQQLQQQVIFGDGLLAYREHAEGTLAPDALLQELEEARRARPDLWHVHSALIQQLIEMKSLDEALRAAEAAVKRFPLLPRVWLDLALTRHARQEYDEEVKALQSALHINSNWSDASRQLAEAERARGDLSEACNVLQRAIDREPRDMRNLAHLADVMWQQGRREEAIEKLKQVVRMEPGFDAAWGRLRSWFAELKQPEGPVEVARELTEARPAETRSWLVLAECCDAAGQPEQCHQAIRRVLELNPLHEQARDIGAQALCQLQRFDEALELVKPTGLASKPSLKLVGAEAEVEAARGNRGRALSLMRHVVKQDPDAAWAWFRLAEWYDNGQQVARYREACEHLIRIAPEAAVSWGYYADGALRAGEMEKAKEAFRKAIDLDPEYIYASHQLFEMLIDEEQYEEAAELLAEVVHHWPEDHGLAEQARAESLLGNKDQTARLFQQLLEVPGLDEDAINTGIGAMVHLEQAEAAEQMMRQRVTSGEAAESVGACWVQLCDFIETLPTVGPVLDDEIGQDDVFGAAAGQYVRFLDRMDQHDEAVAFIARHRQRIDKHSRAWSGAVYALHQAGQQQEAFQWIDGWESREGLTAETLLLPMMALRRGGREEESARISGHALELPVDASSATHAVCLTLQQVLDGPPQQAGEALGMIDGIDPESVTEFARAVLAMLNAIRPAFGGKASYGTSAQRLKRAGADVKEQLQHDQLLKSVYRRLRVKLAEAHGKSFVAWWTKLTS